MVKKLLGAGLGLGLVFLSFGDEPAISVAIQSRYPWNGLVDVKFTITGTNETSYDVSFTAKDKVGGTNITMKTLYKSAGVAADVSCEKLLPGSYSWVWDAEADLGKNSVFEQVAVVGYLLELGSVQLWAGGPYWAECNLGATKPEGAGLKFSWGGTVAGDSSNCAPSLWDKDLLSQGYIDSSGQLTSKYDAATVALGAPWRMPTGSEISALLNNTTTSTTYLNGVYGRKFIGKGEFASRSIFIPMLDTDLSSGLKMSRLWSATPVVVSMEYCAVVLKINQNVAIREPTAEMSSRSHRADLLYIRPVRK